MLQAYRRTGADVPFGDPAGHHGAPMEGYYWRMVDPASGRVVVALCGVVESDGGPRALVALGATGAPARWGWAQGEVRADRSRLGLRAGATLQADPGRLVVDLGPKARLDVAVAAGVPWSRPSLGGLGAAHLVPGLQQYWHPHLLGGAAHGTFSLDGVSHSLQGSSVYAEKNWGRGFPGRWWWGQAQHWDAGDDVCVAFAGGGLLGGGRRLAATVVVARLGGRLLRLVAPLAIVRAAAGEVEWRVRARGPLWSAEIEGRAGIAEPLRLPVAGPAGPRPALVSQHQHGLMRAVLRRRGRTLWRGETRLAALEYGELRDSERRRPRSRGSRSPAGAAGP